MRPDFELSADVTSELAWDPSIRNEDIAVSVRDGVVTLAGTVDTYSQLYAAERAIEHVKGACAIVNDLAVKLPGAHERSDADIAHAAVNALRWNVQVPDDKIRVKVSNGWITLEGEVGLYYERTAAERAVRPLMGVRGVTNMISLRPVPAPNDLKQRIKAGLKRQAELDADGVTVETSGSRVTLRGTVRSMLERREAERAVWRAPGVTRVDNELMVVPTVPVAL
jgi:osmotically-inducible protein OsmY